MSCNGCRVLRKGCSENCMLRQSLQCIDSPQAQAHATVFVAKFFGRAGLMSFLSSVPHPQRPALFQSLLFEAVGRAVNPVSGAVGLLWTGNWNVCQSAVQTVLRGGALQPLPEFSGGGVSGSTEQCFLTRDQKRKVGASFEDDDVQQQVKKCEAINNDLDLCLMIGAAKKKRIRRESTPSEEEEESDTTTLGSRSNSAEPTCSKGGGTDQQETKQLLRLFI